MVRGIHRKASGSRRSGLYKFLGPLESAVMDAVWSSASVTVRQVHQRLLSRRRLAYTTVMTVMSRLAEKGLLHREKRGKAYLYRAAKSRDELRADLASEISRALLADFGDVAVVQFVKEMESLDPAALARLRRLAEVAAEKDE